MSLRALNLNLVPVLRALLRERNLSRAANSLGLTQPAVSGALVRLRAIFDDPLLVREGRGMALTLRAQELIEPVEQICASLEQVMGSERFDPSSAKRRMVIASADYAALIFAPLLIQQLQSVAPGITLHVVDTPHPALEPHAGEVDFFIVPKMLLEHGAHPALRWTMLIKDEFVTVVGARHKLAKVGKPSREQLLAERYVTYYPALSSLDPNILATITGLQGRDVVAQIQQFSLLPVVAMETSCAAIVPRRIAEYMARYMPIRVLDDGPLPIQLDLALAWYAVNENDAAHRWFRNLIVECGVQLT